MKIRSLLVSVSALLLVAGCGKKDDAAATTASASGTSAAASPSATAGARTVELTANDTMKFNMTAIEAKVGEELKIQLTNIGTLPKEAMGHNFVLLKPGSDVMAFSAAAGAARDKDYIPDSLKDQVLVHTKILGPRQSDEVSWKPTAPGVYPFLCSFPGHAPAGMHGTITVK